MRVEPTLTNTQQLLLALSFVFRTTAQMQVQMLIMLIARKLRECVSVWREQKNRFS